MINPNALLNCLLFVTMSASGASPRAVPDIKMSSKQEKIDAVLTIDKGAATRLVNQQSLDDWLAYVVFADSVAEDEIMKLANFQGRIHGTLQCKRIRLGTSPMFPDIKLGVFAEQCTIRSLAH